MDKIEQLLTQKNMRYIMIAVLLFSVFSFNRSCVGAKRVGKLTEENKELKSRLDSSIVELEGLLEDLDNSVITEDKMKDIIMKTPAWQTLRLEEISDKERISINALEAREK